MEVRAIKVILEYFQGDMILTKEQKKEHMCALLNPSKLIKKKRRKLKCSFRRARNGKVGERYRWPNGILLYELSQRYSQISKDKIRSAISSLQTMLDQRVQENISLQ